MPLDIENASVWSVSRSAPTMVPTAVPTALFSATLIAALSHVGESLVSVTVMTTFASSCHVPSDTRTFSVN